MNKSLIYILFLLFFGCKQTVSQVDDYDLIISNVDIFNSRTKQIKKNKSIYIKENIIVNISDFKTPENQANVIDGEGKLIVPGFIDTHVHLDQMFGPGGAITPKEISNSEVYKQALQEQFLKYGVTTVLDLGQPESWLPVSTSWQKTPSIEYPNIYNSGSSLKSDYDWPPEAHFAEIHNKEQAREKLQGYADLGIKHIKLYSWLKRADIIIVLEEAEKLSLVPFGHIDRGEVEISEGIDLGIRNFEHFFSIINGVLNVDEHWIKLNKKYNLSTQVSSVDEWTAKMILYFDYVASSPELSNKIDILLDKIVTSESTISTTIHPLASVADETNFFSTFEHFPPRDKAYFPTFKDLNRDDLKSGITAMMSFIKQAHDKGVKLRIGTDCRYGGKAMMNEFLLLSEAGISTTDILQIATYNGAVAMEIDGKYGNIEIGKIADLVLFDKSPLIDYKNFESNKIIIKDGKRIKFKKVITDLLLEEILNSNVSNAILAYQKQKNNHEYYSVHNSQVIEVGYELIKNRKIPEAIEIFKFCQQEFEDYNNSYNWINEEQLDDEAFMIKNEGDLSNAIKLLEYNSKLFPHSWNAYNSLGELYLINNENEKAKKYFSKSLKLNPNDERAKKMLERIK